MNTGDRTGPVPGRLRMALRCGVQRMAASLLVALAAMTAAPFAAAARAGMSETCERAARIAAQQTGVPLDVLRAITLTETGRRSDGRLEPWPWTVNIEGKGLWFDSYEEALAYADANLRRGARSFDVGCFQLNYKWHGRAFASLADMFDPVRNAVYAARFLRELHEETGNWTDAAGAYHSRTPTYADRYKRRFARIRADLGGTDTAVPILPSAPARVARVNRFPLFVGGGAPASLGSLLPASAGAGGRRLIGGG